MTCKTFLAQNAFKFQVHKLPEFEQFIQSVSFPSIETGDTGGFSNPFQKIAVPGEHMTFNQISATFKVNEDMSNYTEIFDWMQGLGKPHSFAERARLTNPQVDATLSILNPSQSPVIQYKFTDLYPSFLSGFELNYTDAQIQYITASVRFNYTQYEYIRL